jgi:hypothetical protein
MVGNKRSPRYIIAAVVTVLVLFLGSQSFELSRGSGGTERQSGLPQPTLLKDALKKELRESGQTPTESKPVWINEVREVPPSLKERTEPAPTEAKVTPDSMKEPEETELQRQLQRTGTPKQRLHKLRSSFPQDSQVLWVHHSFTRQFISLKEACNFCTHGWQRAKETLSLASSLLLKLAQYSLAVTLDFLTTAHSSGAQRK